MKKSNVSAEKVKDQLTPYDPKKFLEELNNVSVKYHPKSDREYSKEKEAICVKEVKEKIKQAIVSGYGKFLFNAYLKEKHFDDKYYNLYWYGGRFDAELVALYLSNGGEVGEILNAIIGQVKEKNCLGFPFKGGDCLGEIMKILVQRDRSKVSQLLSMHADKFDLMEVAGFDLVKFLTESDESIDIRNFLSNLEKFRDYKLNFEKIAEQIIYRYPKEFKKFLTILEKRMKELEKEQEELHGLYKSSGDEIYKKRDEKIALELPMFTELISVLQKVKKELGFVDKLQGYFSGKVERKLKSSQELEK